MPEKYKRKIRIEGKSDIPVGYFIKIIDAETGEEIPNVASATIHLTPSGVTTAELVYSELYNSNSLFIAEGGEYEERTVIAEHPEIDLTAYECLQGESYGGDKQIAD